MRDGITTPPLAGVLPPTTGESLVGKGPVKFPHYLRVGLNTGTFVLILSGYLALASEPEYRPVLLVFPIVTLLFMPIARKLQLIWRPYKHVATAVTLLFILSLPILGHELGLTKAVTAVVIFVQCYKLLHRMRAADYAVVYLMVFFLVLVACSGSPDATIAFALILFLTSSVWCFLLLQVRRELECVGDAPVAQTGDPLLGPVQPVYAEERTPLRPIAGMAILLALLGLVLTLGLFLLTPRLEAGMLGRAETPLTVTGIASTVALQGQQEITENTDVAFRAEFPEEPNAQYMADMYWRVNALNYYDRNMWMNTENTNTIHDEASNLGFGIMQDRLTVAGLKREGRTVLQDILFEDAGADKVPVLYKPFQIEAAEGILAWDSAKDFTVIRRAKRNMAVHYRVWSVVSPPTPAQLRSVTTDYRSILPKKDLFLLTYARVQDRTKALAVRLTQDQPTVYDKVIAVERYFSGNQFAYSLTVPALDPVSPLDSFINDVRIGHCELYASAMAVMLRTVGIPARVVQGYRGGEWSNTDNAYLIRKSMAHLWVEVYFADYGWVTFDPSPGGALSVTPPDTLARRLNRYLTGAKLWWYQGIVGYRGKVQWGDLFRASAELRNPFQRTANRAPIHNPTPTAAESKDEAAWGAWLVVLTTGTLVLFIWAMWGRLRWGRSTSRPYDENQARAVRLYRELLDVLRRRGIDCNAKSSGEMLNEIEQTDWLDRDTIGKLIAIYNAVRFGTRPLTPAQLKELQYSIRALRAARVTRGVPHQGASA